MKIRAILLLTRLNGLGVGILLVFCLFATLLLNGLGLDRRGRRKEKEFDDEFIFFLLLFDWCFLSSSSSSFSQFSISLLVIIVSKS